MDMKQLTKAEVKEAFKEALKEWLDERAKVAGWGLFKYAFYAGLAIIFYYAITTVGWKPL